MNATLLMEPKGSSTATGLTLAALQATEDGQGSILVVAPADQTVQNRVAFQRALKQRIRASANGTPSF